MNPLFISALELWAGAQTLGGVAVFAARKKVLIQRWWVWLAILSAVALCAAIDEATHSKAALLVLCGVLLVGMTLEVWRLPRLVPWIKLAVSVTLAGLVGAWALGSSVNFFRLLLFVAAFDIGGWVGGHSPLKRGWFSGPIAPNVSPNKSIAGLVGSLLLGTAASVSLQLFSPVQLLISCCLALFGDLLESALKRLAGVKDAGTILPGFGGLLDRFDSMLLAGLMVIWL